MQVAYICSPYRAKDKKTLKRNKKYARDITRIAIDCGLAPVTPHLYITKVVDDNDKEDRYTGLRAGLELLARCDIVMYGSRYGISEGMAGELQEARARGIPRIDIERCATAQELYNKITSGSGDAGCWATVQKMIKDIERDKKVIN